MSKVHLVTTERIEGAYVERYLGIVWGSTSRGRNIVTDLICYVRQLLGGEVPELSRLLDESRQQAQDRLRDAAAARGANCVLGVRFETSNMTDGGVDVLAVGTAVRMARDRSRRGEQINHPVTEGTEKER